MGTGGDFEVYPDRGKLRERGFDVGRGADFVGAFGRHGDARSTNFGEITPLLADEAIAAGDHVMLAPIVSVHVPTSAYNGRTAKGRARRS